VIDDNTVAAAGYPGHPAFVNGMDIATWEEYHEQNEKVHFSWFPLSTFLDGNIHPSRGTGLGPVGPAVVDFLFAATLGPGLSQRFEHLLSWFLKSDIEAFQSKIDVKVVFSPQLADELLASLGPSDSGDTQTRSLEHLTRQAANPTINQRREALESFMNLVGAEDEEEFWDMRRRWKALHLRSSLASHKCGSAVTRGAGIYPSFAAESYYLTLACLSGTSADQDQCPSCKPGSPGCDWPAAIEALAINRTRICTVDTHTADCTEDASKAATNNKCGPQGSFWPCDYNGKYLFPSPGGQYQHLHYQDDAEGKKWDTVQDNPLIKKYAWACYQFYHNLTSSDDLEEKEGLSKPFFGIGEMKNGSTFGGISAQPVGGTPSGHWCFAFQRSDLHKNPLNGTNDSHWIFDGISSNLRTPPNHDVAYQYGLFKNPWFQCNHLQGQATVLSDTEASTITRHADCAAYLEDSAARPNSEYWYWFSSYYAEWYPGGICYSTWRWSDSDVHPGGSESNGYATPTSEVNKFMCNSATITSKEGIRPGHLERMEGAEFRGPGRGPFDDAVEVTPYFVDNPHSSKLSIGRRNFLAAESVVYGETIRNLCSDPDDAYWNETSPRHSAKAFINCAVKSKAPGVEMIGWASQTSKEKQRSGLSKCTMRMKIDRGGNWSDQTILNPFTGHCVSHPANFDPIHNPLGCVDAEHWPSGDGPYCAPQAVASFGHRILEEC